jgi:hypothetical protein
MPVGVCADGANNYLYRANSAQPEWLLTLRNGRVLPLRQQGSCATPNTQKLTRFGVLDDLRRH